MIHRGDPEASGGWTLQKLGACVKIWGSFCPYKKTPASPGALREVSDTPRILASGAWGIWSAPQS